MRKAVPIAAVLGTTVFVAWGVYGAGDRADRTSSGIVRAIISSAEMITGSTDVLPDADAPAARPGDEQGDRDAAVSPATLEQGDPLARDKSKGNSPASLLPLGHTKERKDPAASSEPDAANAEKRESELDAKGSFQAKPGDRLAVLPPSDERGSSTGPAAALVERPLPLDIAPEAGAPADVSTLKRLIELYRKGDIKGGDSGAEAITDSAARAMLEWVAIRTNAKSLDFDRINAFMKAHPRWPTAALTRRRAEEALLRERRPAATVRAFFSSDKPQSAAGRIVLARLLKQEGQEGKANALARLAWRDATMGSELEATIAEEFKEALSRADHRHRMERLLFKEENGAALRAAARANADFVALAKARIAVAGGAKNAQALIDAVPTSVRSDSSYAYARVLHLRRKNKLDEAIKILAEVTTDPVILVDGDEWWTERRIIARKLLDEGEPKKAYEVVRRHGAESEAKKIEAEFHAGWIALRFLDDPTTAAKHFATAEKFAETPISVARVAYWEGRAAEAAGHDEEARRHYRRAAELPITYYGQLARAKLGLNDMPLRRPAPGIAVALEKYEAFRGIRMLYEAGAGDLAVPLLIDLGQRLPDAAHLEALGELVARFKDPRALVLFGKAATQKGQPVDAVAFPTMGIPEFTAYGEPVEKGMVYAIARQESIFDAKAVSHAGARGLMQLMPATARMTAKHAGIGFDAKRLTTDPTYNAKIGADHLRQLVDEWRGSYILTFAAYNAGSGNVKKWIAAYGDPRSPEVDPIDWVERIPFSETRNYVQRVMENLQVYRNQFSAQKPLLIEADLRRGTRNR